VDSPPPVINKIDWYLQNHAGFAGCSLTPVYTNIYRYGKTHHFALGDDVKLRFVPVLMSCRGKLHFDSTTLQRVIPPRID
jgi:hypothetical protein